MRFAIASVGIIGRVCAVLLVTVIAVAAANTIVYEQSSRLTVREDEARRAAEHIIVVAGILESQSPERRMHMASLASSEHFKIKWFPWALEHMRNSPPLDEMRAQMIRWEPALQRADLRLQIAAAPGRGLPQVIGAVKLADSSWLHFAIPNLASNWKLAVSRMLPTLLPLLILLTVGLLLLRGILRPLRILSDAASRVGYSDAVVLEEQGPSEFRRLIRAYNGMQRRICTMINDKVQALAAVGHDLRTPLARLRLSLDAVGDSETRAAMDRDVLEMEQMLSSLLTYYRDGDHLESPEALDIAVMAATVVDDLQDRGCSAGYHGPRHCDILARPLGIKRALSNLAENACLYGGHTDISLSVSDGKVTICVEDPGPGVPEESLERILEPFQRLDSARCRNTSGVGLGLTIAQRAISGDGGTLRLSNRPSGGLRAEFQLPVLQPHPATLRHMAAASQQS
jgi:signal transduction histidine kinase